MLDAGRPEGRVRTVHTVHRQDFCCGRPLAKSDIRDECVLLDATTYIVATSVPCRRVKRAHTPCQVGGATFFRRSNANIGMRYIT